MIPALINPMVGSSAAAAPITGVTWDPATATLVTLSNGNLTVTNASTLDEQGVKVATTSGKTSGKYYFEITVTAMPSGNALDGGFGVCLPTATFTHLGNSGGTDGVIQYITGNCFTNGSNSLHGISGISTGDVIAVAVDLDHREIWFKCIAGSGTGVGWNGNLTYDPATNVGGTSILAGTIVPFASFGADIGIAVDAYTANFGGSAFIGTVPSGFTSGWPV